MSSRSSREQRDAELKAAEAKEKDQRASATQSAYEMMRAKLMAQGLIPASSTSAGTSSIPAASTATPALVVEPASVAVLIGTFASVITLTSVMWFIQSGRLVFP